jgi:hypothetical protein
MPLPPPAEQANNSLREALRSRGYLPDEHGAIRAPLCELPNVGGELRRLARRGERFVELLADEDHALTDEAYAALTAPPPDLSGYRDL